MRSKRLVFSLMVVMVIGLVAGRAMTVQDPDLQNVMKAKMQHLHSVLEGLALEDFDRITKGAQNLGRLSRANAWNIHKTPEYLKFSRDFQDLADAMAINAAAKKLEAVTLDYVQMTMICVKCHTHTRKQGVAFNLPKPVED